MAVLLHERPQTAGGKTRKTPNLPKTSAVVALFAFSSRLDRDTMSLFAKTHSDEVRAAAIAATGQEVLELLHGGLRPKLLRLACAVQQSPARAAQPSPAWQRKPKGRRRKHG